MNAIPPRLPLERHLQKLAKNRDNFPDRTVDYYNRYAAIKEHLLRTAYRNTNAGLAAEGRTLFTQHDEGHVNDVIESAGRLLGLGGARNEPDSRVYAKLNPFEVYAALVAILLHDAGNAQGRKDHECRALSILCGIGEAVVGKNALENRHLAAIAKAHGGRTAANSKDTIPVITEETIRMSNDVRLRARLVAGVVRFADELSEGPNRANPEALKTPYRFPGAVLPNLYSEIIQVNIDLIGKMVRQTYTVPVEYLVGTFPWEGRDMYLIEFIAERLVKCDRERRYCQRYFREVLAIDCIRATVNFEHENDLLGDQTLTAELREEGYPDESVDAKTRLPHFDGHRLAALGVKYATAR